MKPEGVKKPRPPIGVSRVHFIEITVPAAWMIEGELWRFRHGTSLAVGDANDLEAAEPCVTKLVALALINAGKAQVQDITELENLDDFPED